MLFSWPIFMFYYGDSLTKCTVFSSIFFSQLIVEIHAFFCDKLTKFVIFFSRPIIESTDEICGGGGGGFRRPIDEILWDFSLDILTKFMSSFHDQLRKFVVLFRKWLTKFSVLFRENFMKFMISFGDWSTKFVTFFHGHFQKLCDPLRKFQKSFHDQLTNWFWGTRGRITR